MSISHHCASRPRFWFWQSDMELFWHGWIKVLSERESAHAACHAFCLVRATATPKFASPNLSTFGPKYQAGGRQTVHFGSIARTFFAGERLMRGRLIPSDLAKLRQDAIDFAIAIHAKTERFFTVQDWNIPAGFPCSLRRMAAISWEMWTFPISSNLR